MNVIYITNISTSIINNKIIYFTQNPVFSAFAVVQSSLLFPKHIFLTISSSLALSFSSCLTLTNK